MGGDGDAPSVLSPLVSSGGKGYDIVDEVSFLEKEFPDQPVGLATFLRRDGFSTEMDSGGMSGEKSSFLGEFDDGGLGGGVSADSLDFEISRRQRRSAYEQVLRSYDDLQQRTQGFQLAKSKILSYTPGEWIDEVSGMKLSDYHVPKTTSLLLVGPEGSGKSSLVNRISRVFEDDNFLSERAQIELLISPWYNVNEFLPVPDNSSIGHGTYFLQEYMIPSKSTSVCLYDTRSLSVNLSENLEMLKQWMTNGVHHGEPVFRDSDGSTIKARIRCRARKNGYRSSEVKMINFVIFVVNAVSVLKSMASEDESERLYTQMVATAFNCPYLSFRDDKPVVVITHGDLLSLSDRASIRVHLGELLGVPPDKQIFDIPESCDQATEFAIVDMLLYSLLHADRNLPCKGPFCQKWIPLRNRLRTSYGQVIAMSAPAFPFLLVFLGIAIISFLACNRRALNHHKHHAPQSNFNVDWRAIRHLWLGMDV